MNALMFSHDRTSAGRGSLAHWERTKERRIGVTLFVVDLLLLHYVQTVRDVVTHGPRQVSRRCNKWSMPLWAACSPMGTRAYDHDREPRRLPQRSVYVRGFAHAMRALSTGYGTFLA
jgi:hypothetical protein